MLLFLSVLNACFTLYLSIYKKAYMFYSLKSTLLLLLLADSVVLIRCLYVFILEPEGFFEVYFPYFNLYSIGTLFVSLILILSYYHYKKYSPE